MLPAARCAAIVLPGHRASPSRFQERTESPSRYWGAHPVARSASRAEEHGASMRRCWEVSVWWCGASTSRALNSLESLASREGAFRERCRASAQSQSSRCRASFLVRGDDVRGIATERFSCAAPIPAMRRERPSASDAALRNLGNGAGRACRVVLRSSFLLG